MLSNQHHSAEMRNTVSMMTFASVIYAAFLAFTQWVSPFFFKARKLDSGISFTLMLFFLTWLGLATSIWIRDFHHRDDGQFVPHLTRGESLGAASLVFLILFGYEGVKRLIRHMQQAQHTLSTRIAQESLIVLGTGVLIFLTLL